ncbi:MAG: hypothetical protein AB1Z98_18805 [Nannocystaceae bacterium]
MSKRRRPWGLMGLLGLGGLMMMGASGDEPEDDDSGGRGGGSGDDDDGDDPIELPPPVFPPTEEPTVDPIELPPPVFPTEPTEPQPRPTRPGTTDGPRPPVSGGDDPEPIELPPPVFPPPEDDPPWSELLDPYPRGGVFYQVRTGDRFGGTSSTRSIAYRYLLSEAYLTATEVAGMEHEDAMSWAATVAKQDKLRLRVIDLYQCSGWNDAMYGADPVQVSRASAHGRSILLRPVHGPTATLLHAGETPVRNVTMGGNPADGDLRRFELLWSPAIDRVVLWDSGGEVLTTTGMLWPDGSSMENPPPWVMALGIEDGSGALQGAFGCPGTDGELEVDG